MWDRTLTIFGIIVAATAVFVVVTDFTPAHFAMAASQTALVACFWHIRRLERRLEKKRG